jgi:predicted dehydrogenase
MASHSFQPVRIGVVGAGVFGRLHAIQLNGLAEASLAGMVDPDRDKLDAIGKELNAPAWTDLNEAMVNTNAEAWIVAASTASHIPLAARLLATGASVLVEKPLAASLAEAQSLADAVRRGPGRLMVGHVGLFNSEFQQLLAEVRQRETAGPLRFIDAVRHRPASLRERFPHESLFGLLMVHDLYAIQVLARRREPDELRGYETGHLALAELRWADGLTERLTASLLTPPGMAGDGFDRMELFADGWSARIQPNPRPLEVWDDRARWPLELEIGPGARGMLAEELRSFCRVVRGLEAVPAGARYDDALQVQAWLEQLTAP